MRVLLFHFCLLLSFVPQEFNIQASEKIVPRVELSEVKRVFDNGEHNAFTDLCWFKGKIYLTFRSCPDGHMVHPTSYIVVLNSTDGSEWKKVFQFRVPERDTRDPHFVQFADELFIYTGTWYAGSQRPKVRNMNQMLGFGVRTADGESWSQPFELKGTYGHYVWRGATFGDHIYLCARRRGQFAELPDLKKHSQMVQSRLLRSSDGQSFLDVGSFQTEYGDETSFQFDPSGTIQAVSRRGDNKTAQLIRLAPPYLQAEQSDLGRYIGGPLLFNFEDLTLVAGRNIREGRPTTNVSALVDGKLVDLVNLPSGGDCSYPGMVALCPGCVLVSWYSSHEKDENGKSRTAIYTATLNFN